MKTTQYFLHMRERPDRKAIKEEWIIRAMLNPAHMHVQSDGRLRKWAYIEEAGKFLRVVLLPDDETVHNAFFDRNFSGDKHES